MRSALVWAAGACHAHVPPYNGWKERSGLFYWMEREKRIILLFLYPCSFPDVYTDKNDEFDGIII